MGLTHLQTIKLSLEPSSVHGCKTLALYLPAAKLVVKIVAHWRTVVMVVMVVPILSVAWCAEACNPSMDEPHDARPSLRP